MRYTPLSAVLALLLLLGCGPGDSVEGASGADSGRAPWRLTDLWSLAPGSARSHYATRQQRAIRALTQAVDEPLRFDLELGEAPSLSFRPLLGALDVCTFSVTVHSAAGGTATQPTPGAISKRVYEQTHLPSHAALAQVVDVDLDEFAYEKIQLEFVTAAADGRPCTPYWGSASVVDRAAVPMRGFDQALPNILFLTADTLRADALGAWGREPSASPALDRFAERSDVWVDAFSSINNTNPSFASLMTGLYVKNHGVFDLTSELSAEHTTLAEALSGAGYATQAVVSAAHLGRSGLRQGFDSFIQPGGQFYAESVVGMGIEWLQEGGDQPFFLWLHFFDVHTPHTPPEPFVRGIGPSQLGGMGPVPSWAPFREGGLPERRKGQKSPFAGNPKLYSSEVAYLDRQLDRLFDYLESHRLGERTIIVFVADHGETLGERLMFYNHVGLYDETTHVPLMIRWPGQQRGRRIEGLVQHFDVFPTLLAELGLPVPEQDGVDLRSGEPGAPARDVVFANHANDRGEMARTREHLYLVNRRQKKLRNGPHFYELRDDPKARHDLVGQGRPDEVALRERLESWREDRRRTIEPVQRKLDEQERKQLEALGYLD